jgi:hypothetical protein
MAKSKYAGLVKSRFYEIEQWLQNGLSEAQIIKNLGISKTSFETYKHKYPELFDLLLKGRETPVTEVENSLYKNATGYYFFVDEAKIVKDADGGEHVEKVTLKKFKGPETAAICFFLKNKKKKDWCDNPQLIDVRREELDLRRHESEFKSW